MGWSDSGLWNENNFHNMGVVEGPCNSIVFLIILVCLFVSISYELIDARQLEKVGIVSPEQFIAPRTGIQEIPDRYNQTSRWLL